MNKGHMKRLLPLLASVLYLASLTAGAQSETVTTGTAASKPPLPAGSLPARLPENASWTLTFTYEDEAAVRAAQFERGDRVKTLTVSKTGDTYLEQTVRRSGSVEEKWIYNGVQFKGYRNNIGILLISPPSEDGFSPEWSDYSKGDFPELTWLSARNYTGEEKRDKKNTLFFVEDNRRAWLDPETKLPIAAAQGQITMTYVYNDPPEGALAPPQHFLDILAKYRRGLEALSYRPSPVAPEKPLKRQKVVTTPANGENN